jgi:uncharacterized repeat protein (TIGR02543 family)
MTATGQDDLVITFKANGGSGSMDSQTARKDTTVTLNANRFYRNGYTFAGWSTSSLAISADYDDCGRYTIGHSDVTLYAVWNSGYTITFNANGGSGTMQRQFVNAGSSVTLAENTFTRSGYVFEGWALSSTATTALYMDKALCKPTSNITLYAVWSSIRNALHMIAVSGGVLDNSSSKITVSSFSIGEYELTQKIYKEVMGSVPSGCTLIGDNYPVYYVSWYDAVSFCNALSKLDGLSSVYTVNGTSVTADFSKDGYRLPTEAEWEFAGCGGVYGHGYTYSGSDTLTDVAWCATNANSTVHNVGLKVANELGLYDMSGNVCEWCWDWYGSYPTTSQTDYEGPAYGTYRVFHGGSIVDTTSCSLGTRFYDYPTYKLLVGLRVARGTH